MASFCLHRVHRTFFPLFVCRQGTQRHGEKKIYKNERKKRNVERTEDARNALRGLVSKLRSSSSGYAVLREKNRWKLIEMNDRFVRSSSFLSFFFLLLLLLLLFSYLTFIFLFFLFSMYVRLGGGYRISRGFATLFDRVIHNTNETHVATLNKWCVDVYTRINHTLTHIMLTRNRNTCLRRNECSRMRMYQHVRACIVTRISKFVCINLRFSLYIFDLHLYIFHWSYIRVQSRTRTLTRTCRCIHAYIQIHTHTHTHTHKSTCKSDDAMDAMYTCTALRSDS